MSEKPDGIARSRRASADLRAEWERNAPGFIAWARKPNHVRLVGSPQGKALRLRGMNTSVLTGGAVRVGDEIRVTSMSSEPVSGR